VHFIWECKFKLQLKQNPGQADTVKQMAVPEPMNPREAFYGGRTNCRQMHYKCGPGEKIYYIDICRYIVFSYLVSRFVMIHYVSFINVFQFVPVHLQVRHVPHWTPRDHH
jgi:hypothetical protein